MKFLSVLILVYLSCQDSTLNCKNFKFGKFQQNIEEINMKVYSERTLDGFQIDSCKFGISKYKLVWKNDCELESQLIETSIKQSKKHIGRKYYVKILKTLSENEYIYSCNIDNSDFIDQDTILKLN